MPAIIHRPNHSRFPSTESKPDYRAPHYDCMDLPSSLQLTLYIPGVDASGVDITTRGLDLIVTARKARHVRTNWQALHLEKAQRDYQLKLRLGLSFNFAALAASLNRGVLTIVLPKSRLVSAGLPTRQRQVA